MEWGPATQACGELTQTDRFRSSISESFTIVDNRRVVKRKTKRVTADLNSLLKRREDCGHTVSASGLRGFRPWQLL